MKGEIIKILEEGYGLYIADDCSLSYCYFDFIKNKKEIAYYINDAINEMICCGDRGLYSFYKAIDYCTYNTIEAVLKELKNKKLITSQQLEQLMKNLEDADEMYRENKRH